MSRHLKNIVISDLKDKCAVFVSLPPNATPHTKGVRYFHTVEGIDELSGAMNDLKLGAKRRKHIVVRPSRFRKGLHELYTYHFPKTWSSACVANRELIKLAQRQAHALEHAHTPEALEWRIRFFNHYFTVVKGGAKPEPGLKPYARFYQYTYVAIYRQIQAQQRQTTSNDLQKTQILKDVSFDQIDVCSFHADSIRRSVSTAISRSMSSSFSRSFARSPLRSATRRTFQPSSFDESFILKSHATFSG